MSTGTIDRTAREAISSACGEVHDAAETDQVDGVPPGLVARPADTAQVADVLRAAAAHGLTVVPRSRMVDVLEQIDGIAERHGLLVVNVFHAGDGNLHPLVLFDDSEQGAGDAAEKVSGAILDLCIEHGGSITGEHGVGMDKAKYMPRMYNDEDLDTMQLVRCAFDPDTISNPGKVFPTPRLCGEVPGRHKGAHPLQEAGLAEVF